MEAREIYTLSYRMKRCERRLFTFAEDVHDLVDACDDTAGELIRRIDRIKIQAAAYKNAARKLSQITERRRDEFKVAAGISWSAAVEPGYGGLMHYYLGRWWSMRIQLFKPSQPKRYREFLDDYRHALIFARTQRQRNPTRFSLKHHWQARTIASLLKGDTIGTDSAV